jgi:hypothetical protein
MVRRLTARLVLSALCLASTTGLSHSETLARYECNVIGTSPQEALGDRSGHALLTIQYICFGVEGLLKDAIYTASNVTEVDGSKRTYLFGGGVHRVAGGIAVTQIVEGTGSLEMKDGKPAGATNTGKIVFKFASGTLAALSGKTVNFVAKTTGVGRFVTEFIE